MRIPTSEDFHKLMFSVLYPGLLFAVFAQFTISDGVQFIQLISEGTIPIYPRFLFAIVFLFHWTPLYLFYQQESIRSHYNLGLFLVHLAIIFLLLVAFNSLPKYNTTDPNYILFYISITGVGLLIFALDVIIPMTSKHYTSDRCISIINFIFVALGILFTILAIVQDTFSQNTLFVNLFILGIFISSLGTFVCENMPTPDVRKKLGRLGSDD